MLYESIEHRTELKLSRHLPNCTMFDLFRDFFLAFFDNWKWNFGTSEPASSKRRTEQRFVKIPGAVIYFIRRCTDTKILKEQTRGSLIMAISGHRSKASLRNYISHPSSEKIRACSDILSDALSGKSHQSLQPSFAALSSRAIFMFRWIRLSFIQKTLTLNSLFSTWSCEKNRVF